MIKRKGFGVWNMDTNIKEDTGKSEENAKELNVVEDSLIEVRFE